MIQVHIVSNQRPLVCTVDQAEAKRGAAPSSGQTCPARTGFPTSLVFVFKISGDVTYGILGNKSCIHPSHQIKVMFTVKDISRFKAA